MTYADVPQPPSAAPRMALGQAELDFLRFAGPNGAAFLRAFLRPDAFAGGICWPGFFFPIAWLLYRRLYVYAGAAVLLPALASGAGLPQAATWAAPFAVTAMGAMGRTLYAGSARRSIADIRARCADAQAFEAGLARFGGVSVTGAVLGAVLTLGVALQFQVAPGPGH